MFTNNDDTLNAGTQNVTQNNKPSEKEELKGKKLNLKDAATFVAGGVAGGAASVAANAFAGTQNDQEPSEDPEEEKKDDTVVEKTVHEEPTPAPTPKPEPESKPEPKPEPKPEHHTPEQKPELHTPGPKPDDEPAFYRENKVEVESIETSRSEDGDVYHVAHGTMNGHEAHFVDDGHGRVIGYAIDENDNHEIEENEMVHAENQGVTMGNLAEHMVEVEATPTPTPTGNIQVLAVANDVDMGGHNVNVAIIAHGEETGMMIDATQNGEVDLIAVDTNHDGNYSRDETEVVTEAHIPMPTQDDVSPDMTNHDMSGGDGLPDYSNDNDITMYDV